MADWGGGVFVFEVFVLYDQPYKPVILPYILTAVEHLQVHRSRPTLEPPGSHLLRDRASIASPINTHRPPYPNRLLECICTFNEGCLRGRVWPRNRRRRFWQRFGWLGYGRWVTWRSCLSGEDRTQVREREGGCAGGLSEGVSE